MSLPALRAQAYALRAMADAMVETIEQEMGAPAPAASSDCSHLETENVGTFGAPAMKCKTCGAVVP